MSVLWKGAYGRLVVTGLVCWAVAGTAYGVLRLTFGDRPVSVDVRWAATVDGAARVQLEQRYRLARPEPNGDRTFSDRLLARKQRLIQSALVGLMLLVPVLSLTGMASGYMGQRLANFHPDDTDAILYWHQITFVAAGFSGGYYSIGEEGAVASFTHFFAHGPWFIALYGLIGKAVGWTLWSPMLFDVSAVTVALLGGVLAPRSSSSSAQPSCGPPGHCSCCPWR